MFGSIRGSQPDGKGRAFPEDAGDVEPAAMAVEDVLDDREAEAGPTQFARSGIVDAVETLGQAGQMLARDAVAVIGDRDPHHRGRRPVSRPGLYRNRAVAPSIFDRIVEQ